MAEEKIVIPICEKAVLSLNECVAYSGIGINKLQRICGSEEGKAFTFRNGNRFMIKRKEFDIWLSKLEQI